MKTLEKRGITALFPIQKHVFEPAMAGRDLIGRARTGSGKTLAFALPVIESLIKVRLAACHTLKTAVDCFPVAAVEDRHMFCASPTLHLCHVACSALGRHCSGSSSQSDIGLPACKRAMMCRNPQTHLFCLQEDQDAGAKARGRAPRCIILAPTRELAQQVQREFAEAAPTLSVGVFYGGAQSLLLLTVASSQGRPPSDAQLKMHRKNTSVSLFLLPHAPSVCTAEGLCLLCHQQVPRS